MRSPVLLDAYTNVPAHLQTERFERIVESDIGTRYCVNLQNSTLAFSVARDKGQRSRLALSTACFRSLTPELWVGPGVSTQNTPPPLHLGDAQRVNSWSARSTPAISAPGSVRGCERGWRRLASCGMTLPSPHCQAFRANPGILACPYLIQRDRLSH